MDQGHAQVLQNYQNYVTNSTVIQAYVIEKGDIQCVLMQMKAIEECNVS